jgi:peptidoglycan/LPS O-acetylase OafA/YrhL
MPAEVNKQSRSRFWRLQRETSDGSFLPVIDGLRFVAIMAVILFHLNDYLRTKFGLPWPHDGLSGWLAFGYVGVPLFFVLSGFIIARPFVQGRFQGWVPYLRRRITRLEPPYLVNLLLIFVLIILALGGSPAELWPHLLASAAYLHGPIYGQPSLINHVAWSLEVEAQFYLAAPLLLPPLFRMGVIPRRLLLLAIVLCGASFYAVEGVAMWWGGANLLRFSAFFAAGVLISDLSQGDKAITADRNVGYDVIALVGVALMGYVVSEGGLWLYALPVALLCLVAGALSSKYIRALLGFRPIYLIGGMCYTLYLYHFLVISAVGRHLLPLLDRAAPYTFNFILLCGAVIPMILAFSAVVFLVAERPFMTRGPGRTR